MQDTQGCAGLAKEIDPEDLPVLPQRLKISTRRKCLDCRKCHRGIEIRLHSINERFSSLRVWPLIFGCNSPDMVESPGGVGKPLIGCLKRGPVVGEQDGIPEYILIPCF